MGAVTRARSFDGSRNPDLPAGLDEGSDVVNPRALVEVHREKPARLIGKKRIDAHDMPAGEVADHRRIVERDEGLVRAVAALDLG